MPTYEVERIDFKTDKRTGQTWEVSWDEERFRLCHPTGYAIIDCATEDAIEKINVFSLSRNLFIVEPTFGDLFQFATTPEVLAGLRSVVRAGMNAHPRFFFKEKVTSLAIILIGLLIAVAIPAGFAALIIFFPIPDDTPRIRGGKILGWVCLFVEIVSVFAFLISAYQVYKVSRLESELRRE